MPACLFRRNLIMMVQRHDRPNCGGVIGWRGVAFRVRGDIQI